MRAAEELLEARDQAREEAAELRETMAASDKRITELLDLNAYVGRTGGGRAGGGDRPHVSPVVIVVIVIVIVIVLVVTAAATVIAVNVHRHP